jgi:hypothetical protein
MWVCRDRDGVTAQLEKAEFFPALGFLQAEQLADNNLLDPI